LVFSFKTLLADRNICLTALLTVAQRVLSCAFYMSVDAAMSTAVWTVPSMLGAACLSSLIGCAITLCIGLALMEIPFSMPLAVIMGILLLLLGVVVLYRLLRDRSRAALTTKTATLSNVCVRCGENFLLTAIALFSVAGGVFSMWIYLQSKELNSRARLAM
jgi:hypothetical protein